MVEELKISSAKEIKDEYSYEEEKLVKTPKGKVYKITSVDPFMFFGEAAIPLLTIMELVPQMTKKQMDKETFKRMKDVDWNAMRPIILSGVLEPKVSPKKRKDCSDSELSIDEIMRNPYEAVFLYTQIVMFSQSGLNVGASGGKSGESFRAPAMAGNAGRDGDEVLPASEPDSRPEEPPVIDGKV